MTMIKRKQYFPLIIILTLVISHQIGIVKANEGDKQFPDFQNNDSVKVKKDSLHWLTPSQFTPLSFIKALTIPTGKKATSINLTTMFDDFPSDWVKSSDLDSLITLVGSTKKCNCYLSPLSSHIPVNENAEVGGYAIIIINSFRQKERINLGLYNCPKTNKESVEEIMKWWTASSRLNNAIN